MGNKNKKSSLKGGEYMNIAHTIKELNVPKPITPNALVTFCESHQYADRFVKEVEKINKALSNADRETRFSLTVELFRLWIDAERQEEAQTIFGKYYQEFGKKQLSFTFTSIESQFRVWYGRHASVHSNYSPKYVHVDSCGENLLLSVSGHAEVVKQYKEAILESYGTSKLHKTELKDQLGFVAAYEYSPSTQST